MHRRQRSCVNLVAIDFYAVLVVYFFGKVDTCGNLTFMRDNTMKESLMGTTYTRDCSVAFYLSISPL